MGCKWLWAALFCLPLAGNAQTELELLQQSGTTSYLHGDYATARQSLEQAWKLAEETAPNDPARYEILKRLAAVEAAAGQTEEADSALRQAINWRQNVFGESDPTALNDLLEDANLCRVMHDYDRALAIIEQVRMAHVRAEGFDSPPVAADFSRAAQIHLDLKEPEKAASALDASLKILKKLNGEDHPALLPDLDRLGEVRITLRQYDKAEEAYQSALVIRERAVGKNHADLLATLDGLAYARFGQKKYAEAEPVYARLLALWESSAGKEHPMVAVTLDKMAIFYREQQRWAEGQEAAEHANAIRAHFLASGLAQEATERLSENKKDEAVVLYRRALAALEPPHPVFEELRKEIEENLKSLEPPAPPRRKVVPKASKQTGKAVPLQQCGVLPATIAGS
jgi:tetratricopeptide (TPR) repeat protein